MAHICASIVSTTERSFFFFDDFPDWLVELAAVDCNFAEN